MNFRNRRAQPCCSACLLILAGMLAGCTPGVERPEMKRLTEANSIHIQEGWGGLGIASHAEYVLKREGNAFKGEGHFTVGRLEEKASIELPPDVAQKFLRQLGEAKLEKGPYTPLIQHTDDYPSFRIELGLAGGTVVIHSESQGEYHVPWAAEIGSQVYVIDSELPARAYMDLKPYLKPEIRERLANEASKRR